MTTPKNHTFMAIGNTVLGQIPGHLPGHMGADTAVIAGL